MTDKLYRDPFEKLSDAEIEFKNVLFGLPNYDYERLEKYPAAAKKYKRELRALSRYIRDEMKYIDSMQETINKVLSSRNEESI